jgi:hypothetical protein
MNWIDVFATGATTRARVAARRAEDVALSARADGAMEAGAAREAAVIVKDIVCERDASEARVALCVADVH